MRTNENDIMAKELFDIITDTIYDNLELYDALRIDVRNGINNIEAKYNIRNDNIREYVNEIVEDCYDTCVREIANFLTSPCEKCILDYYDYSAIIVDLVDAELNI